MKTIIAGGRDIDNVSLIFGAINASGWADKITEVVCGRARGVDEIGFLWANHIAQVPIKEFPADWKKHGRAAGPIRNAEMAEYADALILIWNGRSPGSKDMLAKAQAAGLQIYQHIVR